MISKKIPYTDYNGVSRNETFFFNLSEAEILEMEYETVGGYTTMLKQIIEAKDDAAIIRVMKELVLKSYGVKSEDGRRFIKNDELRTAFSQTEAYVNLFMELSTNAKKAIEFLNGIMPAKYRKQIDPNMSADDMIKMIEEQTVAENAAKNINADGDA